MVLAKSKNAVGLGNSLMNDRFGRGKGADRKKTSSVKGVTRTGPDGQTYVTPDSKEASWVKMRSVTEQAALDEFLSTAELAGTDFTAEKTNNVKIIHTDQKNPYLLSAAEERGVVRKQQRNRGRLTVPRRPKWDENTTPQQLDVLERESLLEWRRGLAELQENDDLLMTPFERNLEVWRQLWRVIERSDLVVQIVDARNPLLFRSEDLERYVKEVDKKKRNLLLVNKADMMTPRQREAWANYFNQKDINYKFFSASLAKERNEANVEDEDIEEEVENQLSLDDSEHDPLVQETKKIDIQDRKDAEEQWLSEEELDSDEEGNGSTSSDDDRIRILTVDELESLFLENAPTDPSSPSEEASPKKTTIGLVGYPNVGKSSTINALIGAKKVSVSATPGKTKHFQTIHLSDRVILCDCPGLVFPNFATTKAELVVNGILPIDQLREFTGPSTLVAQRIPQPFLEAVYGIKIPIRPLEEGGTGTPTAEELLRAYARARGFATTGQGNPDESRAARYVLKDYVNGKLLFCHPPPPASAQQETDAGAKVADARAFNADLYDFAHLPLKRQQFLLAHPDHETDSPDNPASAAHASASDGASSTAKPPTQLLPSSSGTGTRSHALDKRFFSPSDSASNAGHYTKLPFNTPYTEQGKQRSKELTGRKAKMMAALEAGVDPAEMKMGGKKHFKGRKGALGGGKGKKKEIDDE
ncbi:MAG: hypothetical protein Q9160_001287 [Pyrenula sp. 1 TL-2023]